MTNLLLRHLIECTVLCLAFGSIALCLRQCRASVRHSLWLLSILKFAIPTGLLAATGAWIAAVMPATEWVSSLAPKLLALLTGLFGDWTLPIYSDESSLVSRAFLTVWILGSVVMLGAWLRHWRRAQREFSDPTPAECDALAQGKRKLGFHKQIQLQIVDSTKEPALIGILRPVIAIPRGLSERLTAAEFEAVLLHELAHARRRDNLASALVHCLVCLFWFHPLLWFVERQLTAERERACDELVLNCGSKPEDYLTGLAKVCSFYLLGNEVAGLSAIGGSDLKTRFARIASHRPARPIPYFIRVAIASIGLLITILPIAGGYCEQCVSDGQANYSQLEEGQK